MAMFLSWVRLQLQRAQVVAAMLQVTLRKQLTQIRCPTRPQTTANSQEFKAISALFLPHMMDSKVSQVVQIPINKINSSIWRVWARHLLSIIHLVTKFNLMILFEPRVVIRAITKTRRANNMDKLPKPKTIITPNSNGNSSHNSTCSSSIATSNNNKSEMG